MKVLMFILLAVYSSTALAQTKPAASPKPKKVLMKKHHKGGTI